MLTYLIRRTLYSIPVLLAGSFLVFAMVSATFDPTDDLRGPRGGNVDAAEIERIIQAERQRTGTDRPLVEQYTSWISGAVRFDFGDSWETRATVSSRLWTAFGNTLQLIIWGILVSAVLSVALGVFSAVKQYSIADYVITGFSYVGIAMPTFWFALFASQLMIFTVPDLFGIDKFLYISGLHSPGKSGYFNLDYLQHLVLPIATLTVQIIASWSRFQRASMLEVLSSDYVRTARAKGVPRRKVLARHALRNALIPLVTVMAIDIGLLFGGLVITEQIFSIPGMGRLFIGSLLDGDNPVVAAYVLLTALFVVVFNLIADLLYSVLDPRIRLA
jgi:peptide/nickel transport system permease protein